MDSAFLPFPAPPPWFSKSYCSRCVLLPVRLRVFVCEGRGQLTIGIGLLLKRCSHLFCGADSICACNETARRLSLTRNCNQCLCELGGVARLLTVVAFPKFHLLRSGLVVVLNGPLSATCSPISENLSAESTNFAERTIEDY